MGEFEQEVFKDFNFEKNEENLESKIKEVEEQLDITFPVEYISILKKHNGGNGDIGNYYIDLWSLEDIIDFYEEIGKLKNLIVFASNGCGIAYAFRKTDMQIRWVPMDSLEYEYSKACSENFKQLIIDMHTNNLNDY